jgi:hypothetical protein
VAQASVLHDSERRARSASGPWIDAALSVQTKEDAAFLSAALNYRRSGTTLALWCASDEADPARKAALTKILADPELSLWASPYIETVAAELVAAEPSVLPDLGARLKELLVLRETIIDGFSWMPEDLRSLDAHLLAALRRPGMSLAKLKLLEPVCAAHAREQDAVFASYQHRRELDPAYYAAWNARVARLFARIDAAR